jgi:mycothiol synthase
MKLKQIPWDEAVVGRFLSEMAATDGIPPLSEHKMVRLGGAVDARTAAWAEQGRLVVVSVAALHEGDEPHWALEVATAFDRRQPSAERAALSAAESTIPAGAQTSLWVQRADQQEAAEALGYSERRRVLRMDGALPPDPEAVPSVTLGTVSGTGDEAMITVHNRAFAGHPEASGMTRARLAELRSMPWYDSNGVITAEIDGHLAGFCWTKLHADGTGEVYLLAVDPDHRGRGVGELLAATGFGSLRRSGARQAMLWVDADNEAAIALYRRLGLEPTHANVEMAKERLPS